MISIIFGYFQKYLLPIVAAASFIAGGYIAKLYYSAKIDSIEKQSAQQTIKWNEQLNQARNDHAKREQTILTDSANARDAVKRLQDTLRNERAKCASHYTNAIRIVFGECTERLVTMGENAQRCASERQQLVDGWPKN